MRILADTPVRHSRLSIRMRLAARHCSSLHSRLHTLTPALQQRCTSAAIVAAAAATPLRSFPPLVARRAMSAASAAGAVPAAPTAVDEGGPVQRAVHAKLTRTFTPTYLRVDNESHMHAVPRGSETHFKVTVVAQTFEGMGLLARHRAVNTCLAEELKSGVHALSITARTPLQWEQDHTVAKSPACLGGERSTQQHDKPRHVTPFDDATRSVAGASARGNALEADVSLGS